MNGDQMNMIHTSQQLTKYVLNEELEGDKNLYLIKISSMIQE